MTHSVYVCMCEALHLYSCVFSSVSLPVCEEIGSFRMGSSCQHYYECMYHGNGQVVQSGVKKCVGCLVFNSNLGVCDFPESVPECSTDIKLHNCTSEGRFAVPGTVDKYYECKTNSAGYVERKRKQCAKNEVYDSKQSKCIVVQQKLKDDKRMTECKKRGFFSHPYSCNKYIHCVASGHGSFLSEIKSCPQNLYFNELGGYCDHPQQILALEPLQDHAERM